MVKNKPIVAVLLVAFLMAGIFLWPSESNYQTVTKILRFNYIVRNDSDKLIESSKFSVAIPLNIEGRQQLVTATSSQEFNTRKNDSNGHELEFQLSKLTPYSSKIVDLTLTLQISDKPSSSREPDKAHLAPEKYIESNASEIVALASELKGKTTTATAKNIHIWLVNNIKPSSYTADSKGAIYLIKNKMGDCTEFMYAFIALARANGIPARGISGFWIPGDSSLINAADYHDWAEFYDGDRWVLVDPSKDVFDKPDFSYIVGSPYHSNKKMRWQFDSKATQLTAVQ